MTERLRFGYILEFRLTGYGWHQRSEFNASFSTYRFFSGMQVLHAISRFENFYNALDAPYRSAERMEELSRHSIPELGVPDGHRWASPAVPIAADVLALDHQVYSSRREPVVGWDRSTVFPTWGTLDLMRPFPPRSRDGEAYRFQSLYLAENEHDIRAGDVYWIGKKRVALQVTSVEAHGIRPTEGGDWSSGVYLEVTPAALPIFDSYRIYDVTGRGQVVLQGHFNGSAILCNDRAVPQCLIERVSDR